MRANPESCRPLVLLAQVANTSVDAWHTSTNRDKEILAN